VIRSRRRAHVVWLPWLGGLLVVYLLFPIGAFLVRLVGSDDRGFNQPGLWSALRISVEGATISLLIIVVLGIPLAYWLAHSRHSFASVIGFAVQLPLALPPLMSGIVLIYLVGPYSFLGEHSGDRLNETLAGVVLAQSFVSAPFLVISARSAFATVDPALDDLAATLGHRPLARFFRVHLPLARPGIRAGMILTWLRAFGEYGATVIIAYHPFSLPIYTANQFAGVGLPTTQAPTALALGAAVVVIGVGNLRRPARRRPRALPTPEAPPQESTTPLGFDLDVHVGTFSVRLCHPAGGHRLAILGPSGSGKSVTLKAVAGLLGPRVGTVTYGGADVTGLAPEDRDVGYVPQGLGLMPGRTVWSQATFGVKAVPARAAWWLEVLHLQGLADRLPDQLSGGQRQRVSLARALSTDPRLVLLDEPFSALDAPVRDELVRELRRLQHETGLSTVLVTHDPTEAAMLADELLVVVDGRLLQAGRCADVFRRPASAEVARLLGIDNLLSGVAGPHGSILVGPSDAATPLVTPSSVDPASVTALSLTVASATTWPDGTPVLWRVRPELVVVRAGGAYPVVVTDAVVAGSGTTVTLQLVGGAQLLARSLSVEHLQVGEHCAIDIDPFDVSAWPAGDTGIGAVARGEVRGVGPSPRS
jgi:ABC-type Fe3+/spermidine/putrescine transport system ATPase subunit/ABC-type sulfate transport system permease component